MHQEYRKGKYLISTDLSKLDLEMIYTFLSKSYWAEGIPKETVLRSIRYSLPFGIYHDRKQIGFARVISDFSTYAYISDVFLLESYRGKDISTWLLKCILQHPELQGLRRWNLYTSNAAGFYRKMGFSKLKFPERYLEMYDPNVYKRKPIVRKSKKHPKSI